MENGRLFLARAAFLAALFMSLYSALLISARNSVRTRITGFSDLRPYLSDLSNMRYESFLSNRNRFQSKGISLTKRRMSSNSGRVTSNRMKTITVGVNERNNQPREMDENNEYLPQPPLEPLVLTLSGREKTSISIVVVWSALLRTVMTKRILSWSQLKAEFVDFLETCLTDRDSHTISDNLP
jgi:hypothetical protein